MSIFARRNTIRKTSISIDSIRNSVRNFGQGIKRAKLQADEIIKNTRESNQFRRGLIGKDNQYFRKRQENIKRKQREDELEAQSVKGISKKQGNLFQRSTRGFLGRILDFLGILLIGWAVTNLPKIIEAFQKMIKRIQKVVGILTGFLDGIRDFFTGVKENLDNTLSVFGKFDFRKNKDKIEESLEKAGNNLAVLDRDFITAVNQIAQDEDLQGVDELTEQLESVEPPDATTLATVKKINDISTVAPKTESKEKPTEEIEGRAMGGPVEGLKDGRTEPYLVGENPDGTINDTTELFVPEQSGTIIPNDELMAGDNIEGMSDNIDLGPITPNKTRSGVGANYINSISSSAVQDSFSSNETDSLITGVNSSNMVPVVKNRTTVSRSKGKSRRSTVMIVEKQMPVESNISHSTKKSTNISTVSKSTSATLLDLQSVGVLKYT